jgi:hypothetical protein
MRPLELEFVYAGHWLRQIWRKDHVAVYERSLDKDKPAHELELVIIRVQAEGRTPTGSIIPEREAYPSSSQWGSFGWSFPMRMKDWVLGLAEKLYQMKGGYGSFVRKAISEFKAAAVSSGQSGSQNRIEKRSNFIKLRVFWSDQGKDSGPDDENARFRRLTSPPTERKNYPLEGKLRKDAIRNPDRISSQNTKTATTISGQILAEGGAAASQEDRRHAKL